MISGSRQRSISFFSSLRPYLIRSSLRAAKQHLHSVTYGPPFLKHTMHTSLHSHRNANEMLVVSLQLNR